MPEPIPFPQQNKVLVDPGGNKQEHVLELPVHQVGGLTVSKWRFTTKELEELNRTGVLWVWVAGSVVPPIALEVNSPWPPQEKLDGEDRPQ